MQRYITISTLALIVVTVGCDKREAQSRGSVQGGQRLEAQRVAVLASARESVPFAREFEQLFSGGQISARETRFGWNYDFEVGLYGRYVIEGRVPLTVDTNSMTVLTSGPPVIYINEISRILTLSDGRAEASFSTNCVEIGPAEWMKIVDSRGDFSVVGYKMITNMPLTNFHQICRFPGSLKNERKAGSHQ